MMPILRGTDLLQLLKENVPVVLIFFRDLHNAPPVTVDNLVLLRVLRRILSRIGRGGINGSELWLITN